MHHDIFSGIVSVRDIVRLPRSDIHSRELDYILPRLGFPVYAQVKSGHLPGKILRNLLTGIVIRNTAHRYHEDLFPGLYALRRDYGAVLSVIVHRDNAGKRSISLWSHRPVGKVHARLADSVAYQHGL